MDKLAKQIITSEASAILVAFLNLALTFGWLASGLLLLAVPASFIGWAGLISGLVGHIVLTLLMIADTKTWKPQPSK